MAEDLFDPQITPVRSSGPTGQAQIDADYESNFKNKKKRYPCRLVGGEVAEDLFNRGLCLPSGTQMTEGDLDRVVRVIKKCRD
ncbi:MAG: hypothetical protein JRF30_03920 [Deltaproteobacteria bacterium]|nr:hypothetical protein [Deltaproteobacteria bacterium]